MHRKNLERRQRFSIRKINGITGSIVVGSFGLLILFNDTSVHAEDLTATNPEVTSQPIQSITEPVTQATEISVMKEVPIAEETPTIEEAEVAATIAAEALEAAEELDTAATIATEVVVDPAEETAALTEEDLASEASSFDNSADQIEITVATEPLDAVASRNAIDPTMAMSTLATEATPTATTSEVVSFEPDPVSTLKADVHLVTSDVSEDLGQVIEFGKRHTGNAEITVDKGSIYLDTKLRFSTDFVAGRELAVATNALGESAVRIANTERIIYELNLGALTSFRQTTIPFFFAHEVKENWGEPSLTSDVLIEVLDKNGTTIQESIESFTSHREIPVFVEVQNKLHDDLRNETATNRWGVITDSVTNEKIYTTGVVDKEGNILERSPITIQWLVTNEDVPGANTWAEGQRDIEITVDNANFTVTNPIREEVINKNQPLNYDFSQATVLDYVGNSTEKERVTVTINLLDSLTGEIKDTIQIPIVGRMIVESSIRDIVLSQTIQFTDQIPNLQRQNYPNNINPTKIEAYPGDEERIDILGTATVRGKNETSQQVTLIDEFTYTVGTEAGNHFMISQLTFNPTVYGSRVSNIELYDVNKQLVQILPFANNLTVNPGVHSVRVVFKEGQELDVTNGTSKQLLTYTGSLSQDYSYEEITGTGVLSNRLDVKFLSDVSKPEVTTNFTNDITYQLMPRTLKESKIDLEPSKNSVFLFEKITSGNSQVTSRKADFTQNIPYENVVYRLSLEDGMVPTGHEDKLINKVTDANGITHYDYSLGSFADDRALESYYNAFKLEISSTLDLLNKFGPNSSFVSTTVDHRLYFDKNEAITTTPDEVDQNRVYLTDSYVLTVVTTSDTVVSLVTGNGSNTQTINSMEILDNLQVVGSQINFSESPVSGRYIVMEIPKLSDELTMVLEFLVEPVEGYTISYSIDGGTTWLTDPTDLSLVNRVRYDMNEGFQLLKGEYTKFSLNLKLPIDEVEGHVPGNIYTAGLSEYVQADDSPTLFAPPVKFILAGPKIKYDFDLQSIVQKDGKVYLEENADITSFAPDFEVIVGANSITLAAGQVLDEFVDPDAVPSFNIKPDTTKALSYNRPGTVSNNYAYKITDTTATATYVDLFNITVKADTIREATLADLKLLKFYNADGSLNEFMSKYLIDQIGRENRPYFTDWELAYIEDATQALQETDRAYVLAPNRLVLTTDVGDTIQVYSNLLPSTLFGSVGEIKDPDGSAIQKYLYTNSLTIVQYLAEQDAFLEIVRGILADEASLNAFETASIEKLKTEYYAPLYEIVATDPEMVKYLDSAVEAVYMKNHALPALVAETGSTKGPLVNTTGQALSDMQAMFSDPVYYNNPAYLASHFISMLNPNYGLYIPAYTTMYMQTPIHYVQSGENIKEAQDLGYSGRISNRFDIAMELGSNIFELHSKDMQAAGTFHIFFDENGEIIHSEEIYKDRYRIADDNNVLQFNEGVLSTWQTKIIDYENFETLSDDKYTSMENVLLAIDAFAADALDQYIAKNGISPLVTEEIYAFNKAALIQHLYRGATSMNAYSSSEQSIVYRMGWGSIFSANGSNFAPDYYGVSLNTLMGSLFNNSNSGYTGVVISAPDTFVKDGITYELEKTLRGFMIDLVFDGVVVGKTAQTPEEYSNLTAEEWQARFDELLLPMPGAMNFDQSQFETLVTDPFYIVTEENLAHYQSLGLNVEVGQKIYSSASTNRFINSELNYFPKYEGYSYNMSPNSIHPIYSFYRMKPIEPVILSYVTTSDLYLQPSHELLTGGLPQGSTYEITDDLLPQTIWANNKMYIIDETSIPETRTGEGTFEQQEIKVVYRLTDVFKEEINQREIPYETITYVNPNLQPGEVLELQPGITGLVSISTMTPVDEFGTVIGDSTTVEEEIRAVQHRIIEVGPDTKVLQNPIPFDEDWVANPELPAGTVRVKTYGLTGLEELAYLAMDVTAEKDTYLNIQAGSPEEAALQAEGLTVHVEGDKVFLIKPTAATPTILIAPITQIMEYGTGIVGEDVVVTTTPIPHETIYSPSSELAFREREVIQSGTDGFVTTTATTPTLNGKPNGETVETVTTIDPVQELIQVGNVEEIPAATPMTVRYVVNPNLAKGETKVLVEGQDGFKNTIRTYEVNPTTGELSNPVDTIDTDIPMIERVIEVGNVEEIPVEIPKIVTYLPSSDLPLNTQETVIEGVNGYEKTIRTYEIDPATGEFTSYSDLVDPATLVEMVGQVIHVGNVDESSENTPMTVRYVVNPNLAIGETNVLVEGQAGYKKTLHTYEVDPSTGVLSNPVDTIDTDIPMIERVIEVGIDESRVTPIPYTTEFIVDPSLAFGERKVVQVGVEGQTVEEADYLLNSSTGELKLLAWNTTSSTAAIKEIIAIGNTRQSTITIPFDIIYIEDKTLKLGEEVVDSEGAIGTSVITSVYQIDENGRLIQNSVTETVETVPAQTRIIRRGTAIPWTPIEDTAKTIIPFNTIRRENKTLMVGEERVVQVGSNGEKIGDKVTIEAVDQIIEYGTAIPWTPIEDIAKTIIPFQTIRRENKTLMAGEERIVQVGSNGEMIGNTVTIEAVDQIIEYGTAIPWTPIEETAKTIIPFQTIRRENKDLMVGEERVVQVGSNGEKIGDKVTIEAIDQIIEYGTAIPWTPINPIEPVEPVKPTEPSKPVDIIDLIDPVPAVGAKELDPITNTLPNTGETTYTAILGLLSMVSGLGMLKRRQED